jgi:two-component system alkaline phosphatase synthesis response regulator PhoP
MTQRILVVDDDREIVRLVRAYLEESHYEVLVAYDGEMALHMMRRERPDLVLLDLMPPQRDGWDVTRVVQGDVGLAAMPIIMLTARAADHDDRVGLEPGAGDYVPKPINPREVVARVRAVLRGVQGELSPPKVIRIQELMIDPDAHRVEVGGRAVPLTPTEFALLCALAEQPGHALTRQEMVENGLGHSYEGLERTVDSHVKNLRHKLEEAGKAAHLVKTVFGVGYRLVAGDGAGVACLPAAR